MRGGEHKRPNSRPNPQKSSGGGERASAGGTERERESARARARVRGRFGASGPGAGDREVREEEEEGEEEEERKEKKKKRKRRRRRRVRRRPLPTTDRLSSSLSSSSSKKRQRTSSSTTSTPAAASPATTGTGNYLADAAAEYLRQWDADRASWKFKKNRQTWLLKNMWHPGLVRGPSFVLLLRYLEGLKGAARQKTLEQAQKILDEGLEETGGGSAVAAEARAKSVGLVGSADPEAVEKQRKVTEKLRRIRFSRADALARLLA